MQNHHRGIFRRHMAAEPAEPNRRFNRQLSVCITSYIANASKDRYFIY
jgi:hypothetical protein